jgi:hypothetical protein
MPKVNRVASASAGKDMMSNVVVNCTVQLERLDPKMLQTQPVKRGIGTYTKDAVENRRRACINYRKDISSGFNVLKKWVPGTKDLIRPEILIETVNYIKTLQNEIKEVKKESKKRVKELEKKIKELQTSQTPPREHHPLEPEVVLARDPTGALTSSTMDVTSTSEGKWVTLEDVGVFIPAEEFLLESGEELPDLNSMEELSRWLEL